MKDAPRTPPVGVGAGSKFEYRLYSEKCRGMFCRGSYSRAMLNKSSLRNMASR